MTVDPRRIEVMDDQVAQIMRGKSPAERLSIAFGMWRATRRMIRASLRNQHPNWTDDRFDREVAMRMSHDRDGTR